MSETDVLDLAERVSNAGRWGDDDQRGTLNHIDADAVLRGVATVREGIRRSLAKPLHSGVAGFTHHMLFDSARPRASQDVFSVRSHGFEITHVDALAHGFLDGAVYNGRRADDCISSDGVAFGGIEALIDGIVTRGVFLDIPAAHDRPFLQAGDGIGAKALDLAEVHAGVPLLPGDALFLRSGLDARIAHDGSDTAALPREGLLPDALPWLHQKAVGALLPDCIERLPGDHARIPMPLHQIGLSAMGLVMVDGCDMELLATLCNTYGRNDFLTVVGPLNIPGATGSPVNPLIIF